MSTHTDKDRVSITPVRVSRDELFAQLSNVDGLDESSLAVFDTRNAASMGAAIRVLLRCGYRLSPGSDGIQMIESSAYELHFAPRSDVYDVMGFGGAYWLFKLRYFTDGSPISGPVLALAYRGADGLVRYDGSYAFTSSTTSSDAGKMLHHFEYDHPRARPVWVPLFDGGWIPL